jgi:hypothetical protein
MANLDLLNPFRYGRFAFQLASHKLLRFVAPFLLVATLITSMVLSRDRYYGAILGAQVGFYVVACSGGLIPSLQRNRIIRTAYFFMMVQWAMLRAWGKYALGHQQVTWEPSKRHRITVTASSYQSGPHTR